MEEGERREEQTALLETACDRERVAILFNPASGTEALESRRSTLEQLARAAGLSCPLMETDAELGAAPLAREAVADGMERILVSGGDGTVMEAARAVAGTGVALAVLPGGTGNLLSLNLDLPGETEAAMRLALTGEARPIDVGCANGDVFLIMVGMGLDARMVRDAGRNLKDRLGVLAYFIAALRNLGHRAIRYTITIDGRRIRRRAHTVMVANLGRITGGIELVPGADPDDGLLEVVIVRAESLIAVVGLVWRALRGAIRRDPRVEFFRGREIVIETRLPQPVQLDGNEAPPTARLKVRVQPQAVRIVRPAAVPQGATRPEPAAA